MIEGQLLDGISLCDRRQHIVEFILGKWKFKLKSWKETISPCNQIETIGQNEFKIIFFINKRQKVEFFVKGFRGPVEENVEKVRMLRLICYSNS